VQKWPCSYNWICTWHPYQFILCYGQANSWAFFLADIHIRIIILADHRSHIIDRPYLCRFWRHELQADLRSGTTSLAIQTFVSASKTTNMTTQHWRAARLHLQNGCTYTCCSFCFFRFHVHAFCPSLPQTSVDEELIAESSSASARIQFCQGNFRETACNWSFIVHSNR